VCHVQAGGMKAGTFDAYPSHSADPYQGRSFGSRDSQSGRYFIPSASLKSAPTTSVVDQNVVRFSDVQPCRIVSVLNCLLETIQQCMHTALTGVYWGRGGTRVYAVYQPLVSVYIYSSFFTLYNAIDSSALFLLEGF